MTGQCRDLVRRAYRFRESTRCGFAQAVEDALLWQAGGIAPGTKLLTEHARAVTPAALGGQQREVPDRRRGGNDRRELGMDGNRQRRAGLLLTHGKHAITDMLPANLHHVAPALCREETERKRQTRFGADGMVRLECGNLVLAPGVVPVGLRQLKANAPGRFGTQQLALFTPAKEGTQG